MQTDDITEFSRGGVRLGLWSALVSLLAIAGGVGCGQTIEEEPSVAKPRIQKLDSDEYQIGEQMHLEGQHFAKDQIGKKVTVDGKRFTVANARTKLHFKGEYIGADGKSRPVDFKAPLKVEKSESGKGFKATWLRFGPFGNPFSEDPTTGRFVGKITPINKYFPKDQEMEPMSVVGAPSHREIHVEPSLEIVKLQPKSAKCGTPAERGLAGLPYEIKVRAVGFTPEKFEWRISSIQQGKSLDKYQYFSHKATGPTDTLGDEKGENIQFQPVPPQAKYYVAGIEVRATDRASGRKVVTSLPYTIHRPIEIHYSGELELAEHYAPKPVTACIPGAIGSTATYSEQTSEAKQRSASVSISQNWARSKMKSKTKDWQIGYGVSQTSSTTRERSQTQSQTETTARTNQESYTNSKENSFQRETTKGERWHHENEVGAKGSTEVGVPGLGSAEVEVSGARRWGKAHSKEESKSFGRTVSQSQSESFSKSYTLANSVSNSRSISDTESRSKSKTYNYGVASTSSQRVTKGMSESEERTWVKTKQSTTLTQFSGYIPVGKMGVFYRQTVRHIRRARLTSYNKCGVPSQMGEIHLSTWTWAPDLAIGDSCQKELPESNLPEARCHIPPCN